MAHTFSFLTHSLMLFLSLFSVFLQHAGKGSNIVSHSISTWFTPSLDGGTQPMPGGMRQEQTPLIHQSAPAAVPEDRLESGASSAWDALGKQQVVTLPPHRIHYGAVERGDHHIPLLGTTSPQAGVSSTDTSSDNTPTGATLVAARRKKKFVASWFTPSFVVIALVVLVGDTARGCLFPTLWPLVSSLGGDRIMQGYVVSAFSLGR